MTKPNGYILWEGVSPLDGKPLVLIGTGFAKSTANDKTGDMIQTWILRQDLDPWEAFKGPEGFSNCGDCSHRENRTCYVRWYQAPKSIWKCYRRNGYGRLTDYSLLEGRMLRVGSAGDPAMVPVEVWKALINAAGGHTGYTHQWREDFAQELKGLVQASCDSFQDYLDSTAHGWQPFLVKRKDDPTPNGAVHCPSSEEMGRKTNCSACALCDGSSRPVVINAHGASASRVPSVMEV